MESATYFQFSAQGSDDRLRFSDLTNGGSLCNFSANFNQTRVWLVSPEAFQSGSLLLLGSSATGYPVSGSYAQDNFAELGDPGDLHGPN